MNFFKKIKDSIYNPSYYQELIKQPFSYSLKYFLLFSIIIAVIYTISFSVQVFPTFSKAMKNIEPAILERYPDELVIKIEKGQVSTNMPEPIYFPLPKSDNEKIENMVVIDTNANVGEKEFEQYKTAVLINKNYIASIDSDGKITMNSVSKMNDFTLDKTMISSLIKKIKPWVAAGFPIVALLILIFGYIAVLFKLIYLLFAALLIWLIASIKKTGLDYVKSYQTGIHLLTLPLLVFSLPLPFLNIRFIFTAVLLILAIINIKKTEPSVSAESSIQASPQNAAPSDTTPPPSIPA
jgi:maltodextrin utilization protein YvdJ